VSHWAGVIRNWLRQLFTTGSREQEAVEREEYGDVPDQGKAELERTSLGSFAGTEAGRVAEDELGEFRAPRDPAP
jgi:hypothetical protein